jgi:sarcosine oxidase
MSKSRRAIRDAAPDDAPPSDWQTGSQRDLRKDVRLNSTYEHIVLGVGGVGSAAAYWLAKRGGKNVLAIEQYQLGHDKGASEDHSRIIRHAYHTADYASLTRAAYDHVRALEQETGLDLLRITGGLNLAPNDSAGNAEIGGYARSLAEQGHAYEVMNGTGLAARWPQWRIGAETIGLYQAESGLLDIRRLNSAHISRARALGVTFLDHTPAREITAAAGHVEVHTDDEVFTARTLTICAGSWTDTLTATLGLHIPLTLTQEQVSYFASPDLRPFAPDRFPVWIFHGEETTFYGFPVYGEAGVKLGRDMSGRLVTQQTRSFEPNPEQTAEAAEFLARYLPGALGPELVSKTCVYDLTPDRNFVLDTVPGHPHISLFIGAGHAAKFAALLGHILADLAIDGETSYSIESFTLERPAIRDPGFPTDFRFARAAQEQNADPWTAGSPAGATDGTAGNPAPQQ